MSKPEKIFVLKHTADGLQILRSYEASQDIETADTADLPGVETLTSPRWHHWYQRKLARPWQATLLGMNIEPIPKARRILKTHDEARFNTFRDRLDILQTLMGIEVSLYEDHVREGNGANEKYIELAEYCRYSESLGWAGLNSMHIGLRLENEPPVLKTSKRQENNLLRVLDGVFFCAVPGYKNNKQERSAAAVLNWIGKQGDAVSVVSEPTLRNWFNQMVDLEEEANKN